MSGDPVITIENDSLREFLVKTVYINSDPVDRLIHDKLPPLKKTINKGSFDADEKSHNNSVESISIAS